MYESFSVRRFRGFDDLRVEPLGRINLIAGKNNVGKTALLEALFIHSGMNPELAFRMDRWREIPPSKRPTEMWGPLFLNFDLEAPITMLSTDSQERTRKLVIEAGKSEETVIPYSGDLVDEETGWLEGAVERGDLVFTYTDEFGKTVRGRALIERDRFRFEPAKTGYSWPAVFIPARGRVPEDADRFARLDVEGRQEQVVAVLKAVEKRLKRLTVYPAPGGAQVWGDIGLARAMPLPLIGEGIARTLSMVVALGDAPGGIVLIDEVENGLHHRVMVAVWKGMAQYAREYDVQIFATTHSDECIRSAHAAFEEVGRDDFRLHRLIRQDGEVTAMTYDWEMLEAALDTGLEVR